MWPSHDRRPESSILMLRRYKKFTDEVTSRPVSFHRLSKDQQNVFDIGPYHGGTELLEWRVRGVPKKAQPGAQPEHQG